MKKLLFLFLTVAFQQFIFAQGEDAEGCKDHPMFNRMPDFKINQCTQNFANLDVITGVEKKESQEGTLTHIDYLFNTEPQHKNPSWLQIVKNYENAIIKLGGKKYLVILNMPAINLAKKGKKFG